VSGATEASDDDVVLFDELDDGLVPVGEDGDELLEGPAQLGGEAVGCDVVEHLDLAAVDDLVDEAVNEALVCLRRRRLTCRPAAPRSPLGSLRPR
jgi:hypothetical protein